MKKGRPYDPRKPILQAFGSPAGKFRVAPRIVGVIPPHRVYVEPFMGGGAVFFKKPKAMSEVEAIGDLDAEIAGAYQFIRDCGDKAIARLMALNWTSDRARYKRAWAHRRSDDPVMRFYSFMYRTRFSFRGFSQKTAYAPSLAGTTSKMVLRLPILRARLADVKVWCGDYRTILKEFDGPDTFFFLDPPFAGIPALRDPTKEGSGAWCWNDEEEFEFFDLVDALRGSFFITHGTYLPPGWKAPQTWTVEEETYGGSGLYSKPGEGVGAVSRSILFMQRPCRKGRGPKGKANKVGKGKVRKGKGSNR